jgi:magnesium transporter
MLDLYTLQRDRLVQITADGELPETTTWVDLINPTAEEEAKVERLLKIDIPTQEEMAEIEISSRLYRENDALYMTATLLQRVEGSLPKSCPVTFILAKGRLVTVRYSEPGVFRAFVQQATKSDSNLKSADSVFVAFLEAVVDRAADILETVTADTDAVSRTVFQVDTSGHAIRRDYKAVLSQIGRSGDLTSKVRENLVSVGRLVNFLQAECAATHPQLHEHTVTIGADIRSLTDHATYISNTTVFLLDATVGLIGIDQNNIIKILSVVSVVIMPPMLIASIYGMNFRHMPELDWPIGYPLALAAMVVAAVLPYWYFKRRGWL